MIRSNYHTHTFRCGHAIGSDEEYVLQAIGLGLQNLGFSDHVMLENITQENVRGNFSARIGYFNSIRDLANRYQERIKIYLGFEAEPLKEYFPYYRSLLESGTIDYLILGNHCTLDKGILRAFFGKNTSKKSLYEYRDTLIRGLETGLFSCIAHPDYFMDSYLKWDYHAKKVSRDIIKAAIRYDVPLEFNFALIRRGKVQKGKELRYGYPYLKFWEMVKKYNAKVIIGLDAHSPDDLISDKNDEGYRLVNQMNFNLIDTLPFKKGR